MRSLTRILRFTSQLWKFYLGVVISAVIVAITQLAVPFVIARATDLAVAGVRGNDHHIRDIMLLAVVILVLDVVNSLLTNVNGWLGDIMSAKMRQILSTRYFSKLLELPQSWFDEELTGSITSKLTRSITNVTDFAKAFSNNFFTLLLTTFAVLIISAIYYWPLALLLAIVFPIYVWLTALTSRNWQTHQDVINHHIDTAGGRFQEVVSQIRVVKSYVTEASEQKQFNNHYDATVDATRQQSNHWHLMDTVRRVVLNVIFFGIYAIIFVRTAKGYFGVGDMILLIQLMTMARQPVQMMSYIIDVAQRAVAGSKDYFSVMETRPAHVPQTATTTIREPEPGVPMISFNDTVFSYDGTNRVIDHVTFDVSPGEKVALVGESGGGKSTLVNLLLGLYPVTEGAIMVAGNDISQVTPDALRRRIGVVFQDPALFSGSIRENIAYGTEATDAQIRDAAHRAYADRFIKRFSSSTTPSSGSAVSSSPVARSSASRLPGPCSRTPRSSFSTRPPQPWTPSPSGGCRPVWNPSWPTAPASSSPTASRRSPASTGSSPWTPVASTRSAPRPSWPPPEVSTPSCWPCRHPARRPTARGWSDSASNCNEDRADDGTDAAASRTANRPDAFWAGPQRCHGVVDQVALMSKW